MKNMTVQEYKTMPKVIINGKEYVDKEIFRAYILHLLSLELVESEHRDCLESGIEAAINTIANLP